MSSTKTLDELGTQTKYDETTDYVLPPTTSIHHMEPLRAHGHADARMVTTATPATATLMGIDRRKFHT